MDRFCSYDGLRNDRGLRCLLRRLLVSRTPPVMGRLTRKQVSKETGAGGRGTCRRERIAIRLGD